MDSNRSNFSICCMHILCETILTPSMRSGEYLSYIPRGVGASGLRSSGRTQCVLPLKRKTNTHTPPTIWDKNSPNSVSCRIGFSTLYPSSRGQTGQLQDHWPWWQRTFLGRVSPKSHGVCACLRPSDPSKPVGPPTRWGVRIMVKKVAKTNTGR
jgi:hypothetical protein